MTRRKSFSPDHDAEDLNLPEKCIFAFLGATVDEYAMEADAEVADLFETTTKSYPIYIVRKDGEEFCLLPVMWRLTGQH